MCPTLYRTSRFRSFRRRGPWPRGGSWSKLGWASEPKLFSSLRRADQTFVRFQRSRAGDGPRPAAVFRESDAAQCHGSSSFATPKPSCTRRKAIWGGRSPHTERPTQSAWARIYAPRGSFPIAQFLPRHFARALRSMRSCVSCRKSRHRVNFTARSIVRVPRPSSR